MAGDTFNMKQVLSKPRKADNESEERKCWEREFQSASTAKEKDLRSIPDRIYIRHDEENIVGSVSEHIGAGAATARIARVQTLPTFGNLTWDPAQNCVAKY